MGKYVTIGLEILQKIVACKEQIINVPYKIGIGVIACAVIFLIIGIILDCKRYW